MRKQSEVRTRAQSMTFQGWPLVATHSSQGPSLIRKVKPTGERGSRQEPVRDILDSNYNIHTLPLLSGPSSAPVSVSPSCLGYPQTNNPPVSASEDGITGTNHQTQLTLSEERGKGSSKGYDESNEEMKAEL